MRSKEFGEVIRVAEAVLTQKKVEVVTCDGDPTFAFADIPIKRSLPNFKQALNGRRAVLIAEDRPFANRTDQYSVSGDAVLENRRISDIVNRPII